MAQFHRSSMMFILFGFLFTIPFALHCLGEADGVYRLGNHVDSRPIAEVKTTDVQAGVAINRSFKMKHYWELSLFGTRTEIPMAWYTAALTFGLLHGCVSQKLFEVSGNNKGLLLSLLASGAALYGHAKVNGWMYRKSHGVYAQHPRTYLALHALMQLAGQWLVAKEIGPVAFPLSPTWLLPGLLAAYPFWDASRFVPGMPR